MIKWDALRVKAGVLFYIYVIPGGFCSFFFLFCLLSERGFVFLVGVQAQDSVEYHKLEPEESQVHEEYGRYRCENAEKEVGDLLADEIAQGEEHRQGDGQDEENCRVPARMRLASHLR